MNCATASTASAAQRLRVERRVVGRDCGGCGGGHVRGSLPVGYNAEPELRFRMPTIRRSDSVCQPSSPTIVTSRLRADAVRNRAKVLEAARAAFAEHGAEAQMEDVARRAGVGVGTVYRHFPTKQALAEALVEERFDRTIAFVRELVDEEPDPWRAIERCFEYCAAHAGAATAPGRPRSRRWPAGAMVGPREHQLSELLALEEQLLARARAAGVVREDLKADDMPALFCALASVVQAGVADWRRYLELLLDGSAPAALSGARAPAGGGGYSPTSCAVTSATSCRSFGRALASFIAIRSSRPATSTSTPAIGTRTARAASSSYGGASSRG